MVWSNNLSLTLCTFNFNRHLCGSLIYLNQEIQVQVVEKTNSIDIYRYDDDMLSFAQVRCIISR